MRPFSVSCRPAEGIHEEVNCEQPDIQEDSSMIDFEEEIKKISSQP